MKGRLRSTSFTGFAMLTLFMIQTKASINMLGPYFPEIEFSATATETQASS